MSFIGYKDGKLYMENVAMENVAQTCGTPVYCYSTEQLVDNFHSWQKAMRSVMPDDKFTICYSCKANSNQAVIKVLGKLGAGADIVSVGEIYRAFKAGIPAKKIVFSGVGKTEVELIRAIKNSILQINVESESELNLISKIALKEGPKVNIAFRINPNVDAKTHPKMTTGLRENKFGINIETAPDLYRKARAMPGILATGVAIHIGSQMTGLAPFEESFKCVAVLVQRLRKLGHTITTVDLGGGLGITYKDETPPDLTRYAALIRDIILPLDVHVIVEPGRSISGNAGVLLTRVLHVKNGREKNFLIVDAAMNDLMRPALYGACHPIIPCKEPAENLTKTLTSAKTLYDVVGPVCETADTFLTDAEFQDVSSGDLLAIMVAGAYGAVMSSNYNSRPLVAEVLVSDKQYDVIRKAQNIEDVAKLDILPDWLA
ncbi:MAG: diaminopimelate decarboxylase [Pseudomonadota bacterium]